MTHLVGLSGGPTAPAAGGQGYDWLNEGRISPKQYCINLPAFSVVSPCCYYDLADFGLVIGCLLVTFATHTELVCFVKPIDRFLMTSVLQVADRSIIVIGPILMLTTCATEDSQGR
ncbi:hypothetical protein SprV_0100484700 [Sparganum proliferum]